MTAKPRCQALKCINPYLVGHRTRVVHKVLAGHDVEVESLRALRRVMGLEPA